MSIRRNLNGWKKIKNYASWVKYAWKKRMQKVEIHQDTGIYKSNFELRIPGYSSAWYPSLKDAYADAKKYMRKH